ncbi:hypothetical protein Pcac1_g20940 [Phytophthora cactorum]|nr:hypothetical protein Pcac1_g20940 [Phytophthora cactorum]
MRQRASLPDRIRTTPEPCRPRLKDTTDARMPQTATRTPTEQRRRSANATATGTEGQTEQDAGADFAGAAAIDGCPGMPRPLPRLKTRTARMRQRLHRPERRDRLSRRRVPTSPEQQPSTDAPDDRPHPTEPRLATERTERTTTRLGTPCMPVATTTNPMPGTPTTADARIVRHGCANACTDGTTEQTPVPTSPEQQPSTDAPDATTATPTEDTYGTDAPTPAPTGTKGQTEQTPVPTSPEQQAIDGCPGCHDRYPD